MPRANILLAEDDLSVLQAIADSLSDAGYKVARAPSAREALLQLSDTTDLLITDLWMPGIDGLALLQQAKQRHPLLEVLLITGNATVATAIQAMKSGAFDYLTKPFAPPDLLDIVERALEHRRLQRELAEWQSTPATDTAAADPLTTTLIGQSEKMRAVLDTIRRAAPFKSTVLISGESGTGKELAARALHELSPRKSGSFIAINCAAVPASLIESELFGHERGAFTGATARTTGYFEAAHNGTLLIDEIGELDLNLQSKLLRVIETGTITPIGSTRQRTPDVRILAATNADLQLAVDEKRFRADLFYRLNVVHIQMPPLRDRPADIPLLARHLLDRLCREHNLPLPTLDPAALTALQRYPWPGNVRELRNTLESLLILQQPATLTPQLLPPHIRNAAATTTQTIDLDAAEKATIEKALAQSAGDRPHAAQLLHISLRTLYRKMARYGLR
ncbi:MAG TPA: sigma-54 dependent transcriptional regulator [Phycisphaerae bacterium]|nr:sigma-54 dependent transcriptional regulator [Phycisphaerae bacterium]